MQFVILKLIYNIDFADRRNEQDQSSNYRYGKNRQSVHFSASSPIEQKRQNVIQEIITTEATYLKELMLVEQVRTTYNFIVL